MKFRIETDSMGDVKVPMHSYWGAQTQRSLQNFKIGNIKMPIEIIRSFAIIKKAAAQTNVDLAKFSNKKAQLIFQVCDEIIEGKLDDQFPLSIFQTGSGTHTNMNVNEVIANRAQVISGGVTGDEIKFLHPNDDVNKSQSSNDTFSTAMHIALYTSVIEDCLPGLELLKKTLHKKSKSFKKIIKIGRTHFMDATPITLGQEFSGYVAQVEHCIESIQNSLPRLLELSLGGTAVGTGLNTPAGYDERVARHIAKLTNYPFTTAPNKFATIAAHNALVEVSGALKETAVSLIKIANDIRILASGPRSGIGELQLPVNEPGSSIMPGKVNPTQVEALTMACAQIIGLDLATTIGGMSGQLELNTYKPLIAYATLQSSRLIGDICTSFSKNCISGIKPNLKNISKHVDNSLMLITALNTKVGYDIASKIVKKAVQENITLRESAVELKIMTAQEYDKYVQPKKMVG